MKIYPLYQTIYDHQTKLTFISFKGNMCSGPDELGDTVLRSEFLLKTMTSLLSSSIHHVKKESLWLLSNLTAGSYQSVNAVLNAGLLPIVVEMLDGPSDIRKEVSALRTLPVL